MSPASKPSARESAVGSKPPLHVLLVEGHTLFREGLKHLLFNLRPGTTVLQATSVSEAAEVLLGTSPIDLVFLDLQRHGPNGMQTLVAMRAVARNLPIVVISGSEDTSTVQDAMASGAMGLVATSEGPDQMLAALESAVAGHFHQPVRAQTPSTGTPAQGNSVLERLGLTGRRAQVFVLLARGKSTKAIARELGISDTTVKTHIQAVYDALNVHSRTEAVYKLARHGWLWNEAQEPK